MHICMKLILLENNKKKIKFPQDNPVWGQDGARKSHDILRPSLPAG